MFGNQEHDDSGGYAGSPCGSRKRKWSTGKVTPPGLGKQELTALE
jgi:hypothetical protein